MARPHEERIQKIPVLDDRPPVAGQQVVAHNVDTFVDPGRGQYEAFLEGLSTVNPNIAKFQEGQRANDKNQIDAGARARATGQTKDPSQGDMWSRGYMRMDGAVKGIADQEKIQTAYNTQFDKDTGDIDSFISAQTGDLMKGMNDPHFKEGYERNLAPALNKMRQDFAEYHTKQVSQRMESNAMTLIETGARDYIDKGQPIPDSWIDNAKNRLRIEMGVPGSRFNDLLFTSLKRMGDEGNFAVYDTLKRPRSDGTPGMYFIPAWKEKIDIAQVHAQNVYNEKRNQAEIHAKKDREDRQETSLFSVFDRLTTGDEAGARQQFNTLRSSGLFSRASDLVKWEKMFDDTSKREARPDQQATEAELLSGIYTRKHGYNDVINALNRGDITNTQFKSLLGETRKLKHDDRMAAAEEAKAEKGVYSTPQFRFAKEYLNDALKSGSTPLDPMGIGTNFERTLRANAELRLVQESKDVKNPNELNAIRDKIITESRKAREEWSNGIKKNPAAAGVRYFTPSAVLDAQRRGLLTPTELEAHVVFFENFGDKLQKPKANAR